MKASMLVLKYKASELAKRLRQDADSLETTFNSLDKFLKDEDLTDYSREEMTRKMIEMQKHEDSIQRLARTYMAGVQLVWDKTPTHEEILNAAKKVMQEHKDVIKALGKR